MCDLDRQFSIIERFLTPVDGSGITVFAPTDEAFARISDVELSDDQLEFVILFHIVENPGGPLAFSDLECSQLVETLNGQTSRTKCVQNGSIKYQKGPGNVELLPEIIRPDIPACGDVTVHLVDNVILPNFDKMTGAVAAAPPAEAAPETDEPTFFDSPPPTGYPSYYTDEPTMEKLDESAVEEETEAEMVEPTEPPTEQVTEKPSLEPTLVPTPSPTNSYTGTYTYYTGTYYPTFWYTGTYYPTFEFYPTTTPFPTPDWENWEGWERD